MQQNFTNERKKTIIIPIFWLLYRVKLRKLFNKKVKTFLFLHFIQKSRQNKVMNN